jgi:hypothetical protein
VHEHESREIERRRLRALVEAVSTAADLHPDDYELITLLGVALSKKQYLDAIGSGQLKYARFEPVSHISALGEAPFAESRLRWSGARSEGLEPQPSDS